MSLQQSDNCGSCDLDAGTNDNLCELVANGRLVAYGLSGSRSTIPRLINAEVWRYPIKIDWGSSSIKDGKGGRSYTGVRIFPVLFAPLRAEAVSASSLSEVFNKHVLSDPEVAALADVAIKTAPEFERIFRQGHCYIEGVSQWPVCFERGVVGVLHPEPEKRSRFNSRRTPDSIEVVVAVQALATRYTALIEALRSGEVEARGIPRILGLPHEIPRAIWSHNDFSMNSAGDLFGPNPEPKPFCWYIEHWVAVMLHLPLFHVKPLKRDEVLPDAASQQAVLSGSKLTAGQTSIRSAIESLWPDGIPKGLAVQTRDQKIIQWQKDNDLAVASSKSIYRYLKGAGP